MNKIDTDKIDIDKIEINKMVCSFCNYRTSKLTKSYCVICQLTLNPTSHDTHKIVAVYSIHQQLMINKLYREFILKNNSIPHYHEIDPNCRPIKINPTVLHTIIKLMSDDEKMCFLNIKFFLTDEVNINEIKSTNFFTVISKNTIKYTIKDTSRIGLIKHQQNLFDKYYQKFINNNSTNIQKLFNR